MAHSLRSTFASTPSSAAADSSQSHYQSFAAPTASSNYRSADSGNSSSSIQPPDRANHQRQQQTLSSSPLPPYIQLIAPSGVSRETTSPSPRHLARPRPKSLIVTSRDVEESPPCTPINSVFGQPSPVFHPGLHPSTTTNDRAVDPAAATTETADLLKPTAARAYPYDAQTAPVVLEATSDEIHAARFRAKSEAQARESAYLLRIRQLLGTAPPLLNLPSQFGFQSATIPSDDSVSDLNLNRSNLAGESTHATGL